MEYFFRVASLTIIMISCSTFKSNDKEQTGLEDNQAEYNFPTNAKIIEDLMEFSKYDYSFKDIVESSNMEIKPHYYPLDSFCLVFVPNKRLLAEANFKQSAVIVYTKGNNAWISDTIYNFYNDFQQLKDGLPYFESRNISEIIKGEINYHHSFVQFKNGQLNEIEKLEGFDYTLSIDIKASQNEIINYSKNDTVASVKRITNYQWEDNQITEIEVKQTVKLFESYTTILFITELEDIEMRKIKN